MYLTRRFITIRMSTRLYHWFMSEPDKASPHHHTISNTCFHIILHLRLGLSSSHLPLGFTITCSLTGKHFQTEVDCVPCEVQTKYLYKSVMCYTNFKLQKINPAAHYVTFTTISTSKLSLPFRSQTCVAV